MIRIFVLGLLLGLALTGVTLHFLPAVKLHREPSLISVQANGGNLETFHARLPQDRILAAGQELSLPEGLQWPRSLNGTSAELFKLRNELGAVVGIASRIEGDVGGDGSRVEWALHLPARGSLYLNLSPGPDGLTGTLRAGTREFSGLGGSATERYVESAIGEHDESELRGGRIELMTARRGTGGAR